MAVISLKDVWLKYRIQFKEDGVYSCEDFWAVKNINIEINKGEVFGIIGENGAGKTTLLNIIAGMLKPDRGTVQISGTISAIMEICAGFQRDSTGKENIYLTSSLFGLTNEQISAKYDEIIRFAGLERFIYAPVKVYSSGMYMRLAFAIAIHVDPDILLIDETFAVGDVYAQNKCINKVFELKDQGKTIIFVSQDIEMHKRLCTRGIFIRDGMIVKEGSIDKLCVYYLESAGDKKGIAIVQKGQIGGIFNNGKFILRWKDSAVTCGLAGHAMMISSGKEYLSTNAIWQVQKTTADGEIIAIGRWPDIDVSECWKIVFLNEKEFIWEISIEASEEVCIEGFSALAIFLDSYKTWFTLQGQVDFPEKYAHLSDWQCFAVDDSINRVIGFRGNNTEEKLPAIIFDRMQDNTDVVARVGNTGFSEGGRVIAYQYIPEQLGKKYAKGKYKCFSAKVTVFEDSENNELEHYLDSVRESKIIRKEELSLFCMENKVQIYLQDKLITSGVGLDTLFRCQGRNYSAKTGNRNIRKNSNEEIIITISWDKESLFKQVWRLKLEDNGVIFWEIMMEIDKKVEIINKETELLLNAGYGRWITSRESGDFERLDIKGSVVLSKYVNEFIGVEGVYKTNALVLPDMTFLHEGPAPKTSHIFKSKEKLPVTLLRYREIDFKQDSCILPGRYKYFQGTIKVNSNHKEQADLVKTAARKQPVVNKDAELLENTIELDKLRLVFDYGKSRIFWNEIELTKGLGAYSSVLFKGEWHDSSQAFWSVQRFDRKKIVATGYWSSVPLMQNWEIAILDEKTVSWKITKEMRNDFILEREQVNIMLSERYKKWYAGKHSHGKFPNKFSEHNGLFWNRLWHGDKEVSVGLKNYEIKNGFLSRKFLPAVIFSCSKGCRGYHSVIENTDDLFQARILQYELNLSQGIALDKNNYFEGQIKIIT